MILFSLPDTGPQCDRQMLLLARDTRHVMANGIVRIGPMESDPDLAVGTGRPDQRLVSQFNSEGSSFQGTALFAPDGAHSAIASAFIRIVISA